MRSVNLATFRRHRGDPVIRNMMRGRAVISGRPTINNLHLKTNWKRDSLVVFLSRWNEVSLGSGSWRSWVFGSDADWQWEGCVGGWRRLVVLSVVVMAQRTSHRGEGEEHLWVGEQTGRHLRFSFQCRDPQCWSSDPCSPWNYCLPESGAETQDTQRAKLENSGFTITEHTSFTTDCSSPGMGHRWFYSGSSKRRLASCCWIVSNSNSEKITVIVWDQMTDINYSLLM